MSDWSRHKGYYGVGWVITRVISYYFGIATDDETPSCKSLA